MTKLIVLDIMTPTNGTDVDNIFLTFIFYILYILFLYKLLKNIAPNIAIVNCANYDYIVCVSSNDPLNLLIPKFNS